MIRMKSLIGLLFLVCLLAAAQTVRSQPSATQMSATTGQMIVYAGPPVTIPGTHGVCGIYFVQAFNGTAGEVLSGSVNASGAVDVYVVTSAVFQGWQHQVVAGGDCVPSTLVASQQAATFYKLNATLPATGTYDLVINNLSETSVTVQLNATLASS